MSALGLSGHSFARGKCPLLGVERTSLFAAQMLLTSSGQRSKRFSERLGEKAEATGTVGDMRSGQQPKRKGPETEQIPQSSK